MSDQSDTDTHESNTPGPNEDTRPTQTYIENVLACHESLATSQVSYRYLEYDRFHRIRVSTSAVVYVIQNTIFVYVPINHINLQRLCRLCVSRQRAVLHVGNNHHEIW